MFYTRMSIITTLLCILTLKFKSLLIIYTIYNNNLVYSSHLLFFMINFIILKMKKKSKDININCLYPKFYKIINFLKFLQFFILNIVIIIYQVINYFLVKN